MSKYGIAYIESSDKYLTDLKTLGKNDFNTVKHLTLYMILLDLYNSAEWYEFNEYVKMQLQYKMNTLLLNNPELVKLKITPGVFPTNVNTEQSLYTWRTIFNTSTALKTT